MAKTMAVQELLLASPRKAKEVAVIERLRNIRLHESLKQLSRQIEQGAAYGVIAEQVRLVMGWLASPRRRARSCGRNSR